MEDTKHVVFDIETLGLAANSRVLSIGATWFAESELGESAEVLKTLLSKRVLGLRMNAERQTDRMMSVGTVEFWMNPELHEAVLETFGGRLDVRDVVVDLNHWANRNGLKTSEWWCRGPHFDASILQDLLGEVNVPWRYYKVRDSRTLFALSSANETEVLGNLWSANTDLIPHTAWGDAIIEALAIAQILPQVKKINREANQ